MKQETSITLHGKTGKKIAMGHIYRYFPIVGLVRDDIAKGVFGKVTHGNINVRWGHDESYYGSAAWRGTWKSDGGALMNQTIHAIDLLVWLMGSEPVSAEAMISQRLRNIEAEDLGMAVLRLENGALASVEGTTATFPSKHMADFTVFCEKGMISMGIDSNKPHIKIFSLDENGKVKKLNGKYIRRQFKEGGLFSYKCALNPHMGIYNDLYNAIVNDKQPVADAYAGYSSVDTMMGIYKSAKENRQVSSSSYGRLQYGRYDRVFQGTEKGIPRLQCRSNKKTVNQGSRFLLVHLQGLEPWAH